MRLSETSQCVHHCYNEHESICQTSQNIQTGPFMQLLCNEVLESV